MASPVKNRTFWQSLRHAAGGVVAAVKTERNLRIDLAGTVVVAVAGIAFGISAADWRWLALACGLVLGFEALNSAIEAVVRLQVGAGFDPDPRIGRALDIAAGAVLIAAIVAVVIGVSVFWPYLQEEWAWMH